GFLPFRDLPLRTTAPLELAIGGAAEDDDCEGLLARGWRVCDAFEVAPRHGSTNATFRTPVANLAARSPAAYACRTPGSAIVPSAILPVGSRAWSSIPGRADFGQIPEACSAFAISRRPSAAQGR